MIQKEFKGLKFFAIDKNYSKPINFYIFQIVISLLKYPVDIIGG